MTISLYTDDLPNDFVSGAILAVDTETTGLKLGRDRLCLVQLSAGDGHAALVRIRRNPPPAPNLKRILTDPRILKLFHFARADVAFLLEALKVLTEPVYCTKVASKIARTNTSQHGLRALVEEIIGVDLAKEQQSSDWGADVLTERQLEYAAGDVLYLHAVREALNKRLAREGRKELAEACFGFLPARAMLDVAGWQFDIFAH